MHSGRYTLLPPDPRVLSRMPPSALSPPSSGCVSHPSPLKAPSSSISGLPKEIRCRTLPVGRHFKPPPVDPPPPTLNPPTLNPRVLARIPAAPTVALAVTLAFTFSLTFTPALSVSPAQPTRSRAPSPLSGAIWRRLPAWTSRPPQRWVDATVGHGWLAGLAWWLAVFSWPAR